MPGAVRARSAITDYKQAYARVKIYLERPSFFLLGKLEYLAVRR